MFFRVCVLRKTIGNIRLMLFGWRWTCRDQLPIWFPMRSDRLILERMGPLGFGTSGANFSTTTFFFSIRDACTCEVSPKELPQALGLHESTGLARVRTTSKTMTAHTLPYDKKSAAQKTCLRKQFCASDCRHRRGAGPSRSRSPSACPAQNDRDCHASSV